MGAIGSVATHRTGFLQGGATATDTDTDAGICKAQGEVGREKWGTGSGTDTGGCLVTGVDAREAEG